MAEQVHDRSLRETGHDKDGKEKENKVPQHRAVVAQGAGREVDPMFKVNKHISITEVISNKQRKKQLYVAGVRKNSLTKKPEYQLRETREDQGVLYMSGKWFPEKEIRLA